MSEFSGKSGIYYLFSSKPLNSCVFQSFTCRLKTSKSSEYSETEVFLSQNYGKFAVECDRISKISQVRTIFGFFEKKIFFWKKLDIFQYRELWRLRIFRTSTACVTVHLRRLNKLVSARRKNYRAKLRLR